MNVTEAFRAIAFSAIRFTSFTSNAFIFGLLPTTVLVLRPAFAALRDGDWSQGRRRLARGLENLLEAMLLVSAVATLLGIVLQATVVAGPGGDVSSSAFDAVVSTSFGRWYLVRFPLIIGLFVLLPGRMRTAVSNDDDTKASVAWFVAWGVLAAMLLATSSFSGHASATSPRALSIGNDVAHLVLAATWFTGIIVLAGFLPAVWRGQPERSIEILRPVVTRFARVAGVVIGLLALTGSLNSLFDVESLSDLYETGYGITLTVKIVVFLGILGLGAINHFYVSRRFERSDGDSTKVARLFRKTIALELAFGMSVMVLTGVLTGQQKTRDKPLFQTQSNVEMGDMPVSVSIIE